VAGVALDETAGAFVSKLVGGVQAVRDVRRNLCRNTANDSAVRGLECSSSVALSIHSTASGEHGGGLDQLENLTDAGVMIARREASHSRNMASNSGSTGSGKTVSSATRRLKPRAPC
jgi:hypothetical protein